MVYNAVWSVLVFSQSVLMQSIFFNVSSYIVVRQAAGVSNPTVRLIPVYTEKQPTNKVAIRSL